MTPLLVVLIALALAYDFLNGFHDSSNIVATIISSRVMSPRAALTLTAAAEFVGPFLFGAAVAQTIGAGLVTPASVSPEVVIAALFAAVAWNIATWLLGIPSSSSHALIGGLIGSSILAGGWGAVQLSGLATVIAALFISPLLGLGLGYLFTRLIFFLARNASLKINWFFKNAQVLTGLALALSHGANDPQKTIGVILLGLVSGGYLHSFQAPLWVVVVSAGVMALGTSIGGWRLIKTLGGRFYKIRPVHGFSTQVTSAVVILGAALLGGPVSTTQVVSSAILGVGAAERVSMVRWGVAGQIAAAWLLTIPVTALISALSYLLLRWAL